MIDVTVDYDSGRKKGVLISDYLPNIREHFSVEDKNQAFKRRFAVGYRPQTRIYAITPQGRFDIKLISEVISFLKTIDVKVNLTFTDAFKSAYLAPELKKVVCTLQLPLRDYQRESVEVALSKGGGIILLPTSAGKTLVIATLCKSIQDQFDDNFKALILVPDIQLVQQTYGDLLSYGIPSHTITKWTGSDIPDSNSKIIIANSQILLSKKQDLSLLKNIKMLIVDEVHKLKSGNEINKIIKTIPAIYTFGFTGTLPDSSIDRWNIISRIGSVIYTKKSIELREQKHITDVMIAVLKINYKNPPEFTKPSMTNPTAGYEEEIQYLQTNTYRNQTICKLVNKLDNNTLIMVDRIAHGEVLLEELKKHTTKEIYFVQGSVELEERERIRQIMESSSNIICVAISKIFSTGINIKNLHYVIFASIGKAKIKIIQSIGRSLRLHASKKIATIIDIGDNLRYGNSHLAERLDLYEKESINFNIKEINEC